MGDSCFNSGMISITSRVSQITGTYATCIPTGDNKHEDTINGYFLNMDASIEVFAQKIRNDDKLKNGFNAAGFSQGNNIIRGYIARYNDPPVVNFISVNGVNAGRSFYIVQKCCLMFEFVTNFMSNLTFFRYCSGSLLHPSIP